MRGLAPVSNRVFVDTSAYYALIDETDSSHIQAVATSAAERRYFTTNFVLAESHTLLLRRLGRDIAARFISEIDRGRTVSVRVSMADERRAREIIVTHTDKDYSYTDATSFAVMERLRIGAAFTFDRHFAQYGFEVVGGG